MGGTARPQGAPGLACLPRFDSDPVFPALLDDRPGNEGAFAIELDDLEASEQHYDGHTPILVTVLRDRSGGALEVRDFAPRFTSRGRMFRPTMLIRRIRPLCSEATPFRVERPFDLILGPDESLDGPIASIARDFDERTRDHWTDWSRTLSIPFEWQEEVIRAAITLQLCQFEETGAIVAALTSSIPEAPESGRNWDYRYCWLRDAHLAIQALNRLGATRTMGGFLSRGRRTARGRPRTRVERGGRQLRRVLRRQGDRRLPAAPPRARLRGRGRSALHRDRGGSRARAAPGAVSAALRAADDFGTPRTAFNVCTFWYVSALAAIGRRDEARELF